MNNSTEFREAISLYDWMSRFSPQSRRRLENVNCNANSARHVVLALTYGLIDKDIAAINRIIVSLLLKRLQAQRSGDKLRIRRIQKILQALHMAIDWATGKSEPLKGDHQELGEACRRVINHKLMPIDPTLIRSGQIASGN